MGLDVTAYTSVRLVKPEDPDQESGDWDSMDEAGLIWLETRDFPAQADGLVTGRYETVAYDGTKDGGSRYGLRMPYSRYNRWRSYLAQMVGKVDEDVWKNPEAGPYRVPHQLHRLPAMAPSAPRPRPLSPRTSGACLAERRRRALARVGQEARTGADSERAHR